MTDPADQFDENRLQRDLQALYDPAFEVPAAMSDRILSRTRAQLARPRGMRRLLRWAGAAAAAAAVLLILVRLYMPMDHGRSLATITDDVDGSGKVDILDALVLARRIESNESLETRLVDLNRDGVVDQRDVEAIAMNAVSLDRGGVQ